MNFYRARRRRARRRLRRHRHRSARRDDGRGRRLPRLPARRALHRARRRTAHPAAARWQLGGPEAPRLPARARRADALLDRLRRDRVLDLLRARHRCRACSRPDARRAARRRHLLPDRLAVVRGGNGGDPGDRRRCHLRAPGVQRRARLPDRLGALPRLPDRDRALVDLPAALPWRRARHGRAARVAVGSDRRRRA